MYTKVGFAFHPSQKVSNIHCTHISDIIIEFNTSHGAHIPDPTLSNNLEYRKLYKIQSQPGNTQQMVSATSRE